MTIRTPHLPILALSIALFAPGNVHADNNKTRFLRSLAMPLSLSEGKQLDSLLKAEKTASDASDKSSKTWSAANEAADKAAPGDAALLKKKADALFKLHDADIERYGVASVALEMFKANKRARLPLEVRQTRPSSATTVYLGRSLVGARQEPMLFHLWTAGRRGRQGSNYAFEPSPFHLDVFQTARGKRARQWRRVATTVYEGQNFPDPDQVSVRYLHPATKQSPVLIMVSPIYMATLYTVVTYPTGFGKKKNPGYVQEFSQGGVGGGKSVYDFGVDKRGMMTVLNKSWYGSGPVSTTVLAWNGRQYVAKPAKS